MKTIPKGNHRRGGSCRAVDRLRRRAFANAASTISKPSQAFRSSDGGNQQQPATKTTPCKGTEKRWQGTKGRGQGTTATKKQKLRKGKGGLAQPERKQTQ